MYVDKRDILLVVDSDPSSRAVATIAGRYAAGTVALTAWDSIDLDFEVEAQATRAAQPTIAEALRAASERRIAWVAVRRDFAEPQKLLSDLMVATGQHLHDELPGFMVFLADGEPAPFRRILGIADRRSGPISGLSAHAAVTIAELSGAALDILVIGAEGEDISSSDERTALVINRERALYDQAVAHAAERNVPITWISAGQVDRPWVIVDDVLNAPDADYDLVITDLGDVCLGGSSAMERTVEEVLAEGGVGDVPLRLLSDSTIPILLVIDEVRLGVAPTSFLRAGAMAAMALGVISGGVVATRGLGEGLGPQASTAQTADALIANLEEVVPPEELAAAQAEADTQAAAEADQSEEVTEAEQASQSTEGAEAPAADGVYQAEQAYATSTGTVEQVAAEVPEGGATPDDVAEARADYEDDKDTYNEAKSDLAEAEEDLTTSTEDLEKAQGQAADALTELEAAQQAALEAAPGVAPATTSTRAAAPAPALTEAAQAENDAAEQRLEDAIAQGAEALAAVQHATWDISQAEVEIEDASAAKTEAQAAADESKATYEAYKESLSETRQAPIAGGYNLTARYGDTGGNWSSGMHTGLDFACPSGTTVSAAASGTVVSAGWAGAYGNQIVIEHDDGYTTTYSHLSSINVNVGEEVSTGDKIGEVGSTGNSTGAHLHFEVLQGDQQIDPEAWLGW